MSAPALDVRPCFAWEPDADGPDWVVLGRLRHAALVGTGAPPDLCPRAELRDYVPALRASGLSFPAIERTTGIHTVRHLPEELR